MATSWLPHRKQGRPPREYFGRLHHTLIAWRKAWQAVHPCELFSGRIAFWIDDRANTELVAKILLRAGRAGFPYLHLVVRDRARGGFRTLALNYFGVLQLFEPAYLHERSLVLERHRDEFQQCTRRATGGAGAVRGSIRAHFVLNADGSVGNVRFECDSVADAGVRACVAHVLSRIQFPTPVQEPINMSHRVEFSPQ